VLVYTFDNTIGIVGGFMTTRRRMKNTKEVILFESILQFASKGYHGASIRDIAKAVGIKESSIYNHYKSKHNILEEILTYYLKAMKSALPDASIIDSMAEVEKDPVNFWLKVSALYIQALPPLMSDIGLLMANEIYLNDFVREFVQEHVFTVQKTMTIQSLMYMVSKGMIEACDYEMVASQYVYLLYGLETENRMRRLSGENEEIINARIMDQLSYFIGQLK